MTIKHKIVIAMDGMPLARATSIAQATHDCVWGFKEHVLGDADPEGHCKVIGNLKAWGCVLADRKIYEVPREARNLARAFARHGAWIVTAHACGGIDMLRAAAEGFAEARPELDFAKLGIGGIAAVIFLSSLSKDQIRGMYGDLERKADQFAQYARDGGAWGIIASPLVIRLLAGKYPELKRIAVGVRPEGSSELDQVRFDTIQNFATLGADYYIIGSMITTASDPGYAARVLARTIEGATR
ncbi:orotidine 5'-phosphate decarboxylase [Candidatus Kaiserbacteria bacterium]|nr:orotidine 5'-phosphate decarboxylase [Candidatus Kaiserbacteria bacterium]